MPFIRRLWSKALGDLPEDWNSDDPTQKLGAAELWILSLICMYGIFIGEFYSITGHPLIVASYRFIQHGCIPLCALGVVLAWQQRKLPILPLLGLLAATVPFVIRMDFEGKLRRRLSGEYFEAHSMWIAIPLILSLVLALWSLWKDDLKLHKWGMGAGLASKAISPFVSTSCTAASRSTGLLPHKCATTFSALTTFPSRVLFAGHSRWSHDTERIAH